MSIAPEKLAEVLALPQQDRAYLALELIASLDATVDADAETEWRAVVDRRSREIEEGTVSCRPVAQAVHEVRGMLHARRQPSCFRRACRHPLDQSGDAPAPPSAVLETPRLSRRPR
jgi:hypothetical protein